MIKRILLILIILPSLTSASIAEVFSGSSDYFGLGLSVTEMKGVGTINNAVYDWNRMQPSQFGPCPYGFLGVDLSSYMGFELGFFSTREKSKEVDFGNDPTGSFFGYTSVDSFDIARIHLTLRHLYLTARGYAPFWQKYRFYVEGGVSYEQNQLHAMVTDVVQGMAGIKTSVKEGFVWRLGMGVEYLFTNMFGGRVALLANGTSNVEVSFETIANGYNVYKVKPFRDSYSAMAAFFVRF